MQSNRWIRRLAMTASLLLLLAGYHNCGKTPMIPSLAIIPAPPVPSEPSVGPSNSGGNGEGYDGKTYDDVLATGTCPDGSDVAASIIFIDPSHPVLTRENCQNITPVALDPTEVTIAQNQPNVLIYGSHLFEAFKSGATSHMAFICKPSASNTNAAIPSQFSVRAWDNGTYTGDLIFSGWSDSGPFPLTKTSYSADFTGTLVGGQKVNLFGLTLTPFDGTYSATFSIATGGAHYSATMKCVGQ
jgi:hypothetical protein